MGGAGSVRWLRCRPRGLRPLLTIPLHQSISPGSNALFTALLNHSLAMAPLSLMNVSMVPKAQSHAVAFPRCKLPTFSFSPSTLNRNDVVNTLRWSHMIFCLAHLADGMLPDYLNTQLLPLLAVHDLDIKF